MGNSSYSDSFYDDRVKHRAATGTPTFVHHAAVTSGKVAAGVHDSLNIRGKIREARDSKEHPNSTAIGVIFDETGSMGEVPRMMQAELPKLMGLLLRKSYIEDPQILFGAVGDAINPHGEKAPIQIGQFESGIEMDDNITHIYLEGQGGGSFEESYGLPLYYFAHRTSCDCFEKRGKKGYLFLIGDETAYSWVTRAELDTWLGVNVQDDVPLEAVIAAVREKWELFFVIPNLTSHYAESALASFWRRHLGQNVIKLEDPKAICETIGATIGLCEGRTTADGLAADLHGVGATAAAVSATASAVSDIARERALTVMGSGGSLPVRDGGRSAKNERL